MNQRVLAAVIVSALLAAPLALTSLTMPAGNLSDVLNQPGFWHFYLKAFLWFFICGVTASTLTLLWAGLKK